jgi:tetratricopeptide (TPR) repeat protein
MTAGRELGVDAVIYGSLKRFSGRIAIDAQLVRVGDGVSLWKSGFEGESRNVFTLQNSISSAVTRVLSPNADTRDIQSAPPPSTLNLDAYEACEKGWFFLSKRTAAGIHLSVGYFERAITEDPNYALAYAGLAEAYAFDSENWKKAESTALRALEIDKNLAEAHAIIGFVHRFWLLDWEAAEREFKRAIEPDFNCATAHQWYAVYLAARGRMPVAKEEMRKALELDPFSVPINADMGQMFYLSQQYDEGIEQCQKTIAMDPDFLNAHIYLYEAYTQRGMYDQAFAEYFNIQKLAADNLLYSPAAEESLRKGYQDLGIKGFWKARLAFLEKRSHDDLAVAEYYARLGEKDQALTLLEKAYARHSFDLALIAVNPIFSDLRTGHRFERLNQRIFPENTNQRPQNAKDFVKTR